MSQSISYYQFQLKEENLKNPAPIFQVCISPFSSWPSVTKSIIEWFPWTKIGVWKKFWPLFSFVIGKQVSFPFQIVTNIPWSALLKCMPGNWTGRQQHHHNNNNTHFIPPFRNYSQLKEKMIKIKIKGYQLLEITKKLTSSGSWFNSWN